MCCPHNLGRFILKSEVLFLFGAEYIVMHLPVKKLFGFIKIIYLTEHPHELCERRLGGHIMRFQRFQIVLDDRADPVYRKVAPLVGHLVVMTISFPLSAASFTCWK